MTYRGVAKGKTIELEEPLPYCEGQLVSVSVEPLYPEDQAGSPVAIVKVMQKLPRLDPEDVDALEQAIERGKLPVRTQGVFGHGGPEKPR